MPSAKERAPLANPSKTGLEEHIDACRETTFRAQSYLGRPPVQDRELLDRLGRLYGRMALELQREAMEGATDELLAEHKCSRGVVSRALKALLGLGMCDAEGSGWPEAVLLASHETVAAFTKLGDDERSCLSLPTVRRGLRVLVDAQVVLYTAGRDHHPSVWGWPWLVDRIPEARQRLAERRRDLPPWAQPMIVTLQRSLPDARVYELAARDAAYWDALSLEREGRRERIRDRKQAKDARAAERAWAASQGLDPDAYAQVREIARGVETARNRRQPQKPRDRAKAEEKRALRKSLSRPDAPEPERSRDHDDHVVGCGDYGSTPRQDATKSRRSRDHGDHTTVFGSSLREAPREPDRTKARSAQRLSPEAPAAPVASREAEDEVTARIVAAAERGEAWAITARRTLERVLGGAPVPSASPASSGRSAEPSLGKGGFAPRQSVGLDACQLASIGIGEASRQLYAPETREDPGPHPTQRIDSDRSPGTPLVSREGPPVTTSRTPAEGPGQFTY